MHIANPRRLERKLAPPRRPHNLARFTDRQLEQRMPLRPKQRRGYIDEELIDDTLTDELTCQRLDAAACFIAL